MYIPWIAFIAAVTIAYALTGPTIRLAKKYRFVTDKRHRKHPAHTHTGIIPRAGGLPIYIAILIPSLMFLEVNRIIISILVASGLLIITGLFDDYYDVSPYLRFFLNILISAIVVSAGLGIPFVSNPLGGVIRLDTITYTFTLFGEHTILIVANLLSIIWLTWLMNMVNWSKGVDGQLPGFVAITAIFLGFLAQRFTSHDISAQNVMILSFIVSGAYLGFLPFNFFPQRIMPGYGGGALAGFMLGILSILSFGKVGTAILILAIPMIDAVYVICRRLRKGKSPFQADWGHFHHRLLEIGWGKRRIALFYWCISLFLGTVSLFIEGLEKLIAFITIGIMLILFIIVIERIKEVDSDIIQSEDV